MERRPIPAPRQEDQDEEDEEHEDTFLEGKELEEDETGIHDESLWRPDSTRTTRRCRSVVDCIAATEGSPPGTSPSSPKQKNRRVQSSSDVESVDRGYPTSPESTESQGGQRLSRYVDAHDANVGNAPSDDEDTQTKNVSEPISVPVQIDDRRYKMTHKNRGRCVIFNHQKFDTGFDERKGTDADAKRIEATFSGLGFKVETLHDCLHSEVLEKIKELSEEDHSDDDCLCIFLLTHGLSNDLISAKDVAYRSDVIWKPFTADKCISLAGKPKLIFFQACRGTKMDGGVVVRRSADRTETDSSIASYKIPTHADFLIAHSTVQGFLSWRNPEEGTWYVQCLCDVLDQYWKTTDLLSMLTITARKVATEFTSYDDRDLSKNQKTQVPTMTSMLIRDIYFTPKPRREPEEGIADAPRPASAGTET